MRAALAPSRKADDDFQLLSRFRSRAPLLSILPGFWPHIIISAPDFIEALRHKFTF